MLSSSINRFGGLLAIFVLLLLQGCATTAQKSASMRQFLEHGRPDQALIEVEKEGETDDVMVNMNKGMLLRMTGDYTGSNVAFEQAKNRIEELYSTSITESAGSVILNDETISFDGDKHEQVLVHLYMAANYIDLGDYDAARVEVLQSHVKMNEWGEPKDEVPFMRYFSGMLFEILGEQDSALVSYRKAVDAYKITKARHGLNIPVQLKRDFLRLLAAERLWNEYKRYKNEFGMKGMKAPNKGMGELIVIMNNGLVPQRQQHTIHTWSNAMAMNIKIALPTYPFPPAYVDQVRVTAGNQGKLLETVSNLDGMARAALAENLPAITARAIARAVVKKKSEKEAGDRNGALGQFAMMILNQATEIADTRCWNTLPQQIQLARLWLPSGSHTVTLEVLGAGGVLRDTIEVPVTIKAGGKTVLIEHWTAPRPLRETQNLAGDPKTLARVGQ